MDSDISDWSDWCDGSDWSDWSDSYDDLSDLEPPKGGVSPHILITYQERKKGERTIITLYIASLSESPRSEVNTVHCCSVEIIGLRLAR